MDIRGNNYIGGREASEDVLAWYECEVGKDLLGVTENKIQVMQRGRLAGMGGW